MEITAGSALLGWWLKKLRFQAGMTADNVADTLNCSISRVYAFEGGYRILETDELAELVGTVYAHPQLVEKIEALRMRALNPRGEWASEWQNYPDVNPNLSLYAQLEFMATRIIDTTVDIIPGEFQNHEYSMIQHKLTGKSEHIAEQYTAVRMVRQHRLLHCESPPTVDCIITEGALQRAAYVDGQVQTLIYWADQPTITIRIVPNVAGPHNVLASFVVLELPDDLPRILHLDGITSEVVVDDPVEVSRALAYREQLAAHSLNVDESLSMMRSVLDVR